MTSADRLDRLLRTQLHRADDLTVDSPYDAVVTRSAQRTRRRRASIAATAAVLTAAGLAGYVQLRPDPAPPAVVDQEAATIEGTWTRTVTEGTVGDGTWTLDFGASNDLELEGPPDRPARSVTDGASFDVSEDRLRTNIFVNGACDTAQIGTYRWTRDGGLLYLEVVADECEDRSDLLVGTWVEGS